MFMKSGKCNPPPFSSPPPQIYSVLSRRVPNVQQSITCQGKKADMFQLLIRAEQCRDDDSRLKSPSQLIAEECSASLEEVDDALNGIWNLISQIETWNQTLKTRNKRVTIIRIPSEFLQFHGGEFCIKFKVTVYTHGHQCHFFPPHFIIINDISPGRRVSGRS